MKMVCVFVCVCVCARARCKCATFVSACIQSCCVSCVSAPTISARSVCRYSSTVNTALPEKHSSTLENVRCPHKWKWGEKKKKKQQNLHTLNINV